MTQSAADMGRCDLHSNRGFYGNESDLFAAGSESRLRLCFCYRKKRVIEENKEERIECLQQSTEGEDCGSLLFWQTVGH